MAVQKSRKTPSKRGMRRAHDALTPPPLSIEPVSGETHRRHHVSPSGYYRGRKIITETE
jgi:large subunit ribosomal protein L32